MAGSVGDSPDTTQIAASSLWYLGDGDRSFSPAERRLTAGKKTELYVIAGADHVTTFTRSADVLPAVLPFLVSARVPADRHGRRPPGRV
jgi:pimeloyl-ACP methyl ester carboxylesterase